ncbi:MAG: protein-export chaperone SecB [Gammaproteobacteria bacterium]|nr:protein-export chaperone SecB [Gammaproteobacteria bacterium]
MNDQAQPRRPAFELEKIYVKDVSFESPAAPGIFVEKDYRPDINIDLNIEYRAMDREQGYFEVVLNIEIKASSGERTAFLVAVQQAGVFRIANFTDEQMPVMLEVAAPNALLPFAREAIADLVTRGGFPQLLIQPVNFEVLLKNRLKQQQAESAG